MPLIERDRPANEILDDLLAHGSLSVVVELVEHRYRDRRRRATLTVLIGVATMLITALGLAYEVYTRSEAADEDREKQQLEALEAREQQAREALAIQERVTRYGNELERASTRLTFARTSQSFDHPETQTLTLNVPLNFSLEAGQRKHFEFSGEDAGVYVIQVSVSGRTGGTGGVPLTPMLYLYQRTSGVADPIDFSSTRSLYFDYRGGTYYLEVEELLREPSDLTLTVRASGRDS